MGEFDYRNIPLIGELKSLHGAFDPAAAVKDHKTLAEREQHNNKIVKDLETAVALSGLKNGMTISFHHHFRDGDYIVNMVLDKLAEMGFRDLVVAASSLSDCHAPMIGHIKSGLIRRIETSGLRGELAEAVSRGLMDTPVIFRSHGGRAYAIETGELHIDAAFLGAPSCDPYGNANGYIRGIDQGIMCGSMGYAKTDAQYADKTIIITNHIVPYPNIPFGIPESDVEYVVVVDEIGDPEGIMKGATRFTKSPMELLMASTCADVIEATGRFTGGFSMQMGSGGASLAVVRFLRERMLRQKICASFALGGITAQIVEMHEEGLIKKILDVQSFDLAAAKSLKNNRFHSQISASYYASPSNKGTAVNQLDIVVLSALEMDVNYNVNVLTGSDGIIRGAIGGHPDTSQGASVSIIIVPLTRGRIPCVVDRVNTVVTPGETVDVVVTNQGVAVNPRRPLLAEKIRNYGIPLCTIEELRDKAVRIVGNPEPVKYRDRIVGIVAYRDNTVIDGIRQVAE
jgi:citrate lyase subunit alpha/citrate CoA-transferase